MSGRSGKLRKTVPEIDVMGAQGGGGKRRRLPPPAPGKLKICFHYMCGLFTNFLELQANCVTIFLFGHSINYLAILTLNNSNLDLRIQGFMC